MRYKLEVDRKIGTPFNVMGIKNYPYLKGLFNHFQKDPDVVSIILYKRFLWWWTVEERWDKT